ncbi:immunoglobulin superfamily member 1-like isoform X3 [Engystomops pustulosus]|uniref:immunoglobulin superfamily member 1-like isoform X3 n=1 Tax=Engystomops pustulosus TaxID=76066 RepID=UPI003AFA2185
MFYFKILSRNFLSDTYEITRGIKMGPVTYCFTSVVCSILMITQGGVYGNFRKPILEIDTEDPNDVNMIGITAYLNCISSLNADQYYLMKEGIQNAIKEQHTPVFTITNLTERDSGLYTCRYRKNSELSEHSEPVYLYASDRYYPPTIIAEPKSIVQPGQNVTIICNTPYQNILFTLFKGDTVIEETEANPFIHVIHNASEEHAGQYSCRYKKLQLQSYFSSPLMIIIKALPRPLIILDDYMKGKLKINCKAPEKDKKMWFQLFNGSNDVVDEIKAVTESAVDFILPYPEGSYQRYYCMYRIRMGSNFADSLPSDELIIGTDSSRNPDFTLRNMIRLLLSAIVVLILIAIAVIHFQSIKRCRSIPTTPTAPRLKLAVESEYTQMMEMRTDNPLEKSLTSSPHTTVVSAMVQMADAQEEESL